MSRSHLARLAGVIGAGGAVVQIAYGVVALAVGYPAIAEARLYEAIWGVANIGMAAGAIAWAAADFARPRTAAVLGAILVAVGSLVRIAVSVLPAEARVLCQSSVALRWPAWMALQRRRQ
jgi:hypothetical protein